MTTTNGDQLPKLRLSIPWFGARKMARKLMAEIQGLCVQRDAMRDQLERVGAMAGGLVAEVKTLRAERETTHKQLEALGALPVLQLEARRIELERLIADQAARLERERADAASALAAMKQQLIEARQSIVATDDLALLQEVGVYQYRHPLTDVVAYEKQLQAIEDDIKAMTRKDGGAVLATNEWTVNGSATEGRAMVRDFSKLIAASIQR